MFKIYVHFYINETLSDWFYKLKQSNIHYYNTTCLRIFKK